jgi:hypothetical protein
MEGHFFSKVPGNSGWIFAWTNEEGDYLSLFSVQVLIDP